MMIVQRPYLTARSAAFDRSAIDRVFSQLTRELFTPARRTPVVDAGWNEGSLVLTVDLPGVPADQVAVDVAEGTLTVSATLDGERWQRSVRLGASLDGDRAEARYVDGRLTVTVPEVAKAAPRALVIDTTPAPVPVPAVDAASAEDPAEAKLAASEQARPADES